MSDKQTKTVSKYKDYQIGYVIEIPDSKSIIINAGKNQHISLNDKIIVYEEGPEIVDSKTRNIIGRKDFIKAELSVVEIYDNFSVCQMIKTEKNGGIYSMASIMNGVEKNYAADLPLKGNEIKNWKIQNKLISINDPVKKA